MKALRRFWRMAGGFSASRDRVRAERAERCECWADSHLVEKWKYCFYQEEKQQMKRASFNSSSKLESMMVVGGGVVNVRARWSVGAIDRNIPQSEFIAISKFEVGGMGDTSSTQFHHRHAERSQEFRARLATFPQCNIICWLWGGSAFNSFLRPHFVFSTHWASFWKCLAWA